VDIRRREDIDPEDGVRKYGDVDFADAVNKRYPVDTPEQVRAAWARIHIPRNAMFYSVDELELIKSRIAQAAEMLGVELSEEVVEREARLFTAGDYPDRGVEVTEEDLDRIIERQQPVPIKIEHTDTPLDLGVVTRIWRKGRDLFGRLAFTAPAWALVDACGAKKLSAAIKRDKSELTEVSLVRTPRVAGAVVFGEGIHPPQSPLAEGGGLVVPRSGHAAGEAELGSPPCEGGVRGGDSSLVQFEFSIDEGGEDMSEAKAVEFSRRIEELERQLKSREVDGQIDALKRAGKLVPAAEEAARVLLSAGEGQVVTFSDGREKPVARVFAEFLESQPKVVEFSELAGGASEELDMTEEEREFYAKLGVSPEAVVKQKGR
jgi:hypothetical protein